ncbi:1,4-alpha-glucan branching enzyme [Bacteroidia bacterium]|nr:1,4-alpha-glucan branching enzyme [Bacteroidia bacterium]
MIARRLARIDAKEKEFTGGNKKLSDVAVNHLFFGLHKTKEGWVIREWAPNAQYVYLIGDFNAWKADSQWKFANIGGGRWELNLPNNALQHGMFYKLLVCWEGGSGERLPSHCRRVVQDAKTKLFAAQVWQPEKPYQWKNTSTNYQVPTTKSQVPSPNSGKWSLVAGRWLLIYEAHIGMATDKYEVGSYENFRLHVLPRIADLGYNTLQLMAIQEHPYYGSFGYQVSNFYAPSSRYGTPEELKALIDDAHGLGLAVIMDIVHSHAVKNDNEGLSHFDGTEYQYFHAGSKGQHPVWDSRCFNYGKNEVIALLLSNCHYWMQEFGFDGFRFDGVTSMIYTHHGLGVGFTHYDMYYNGEQDEDAITYLALANRLIHEINPHAISIAEDVSGMPGLAMANECGGIGFDYRMSMGVADFWIKTLKTKQDEQWHVGEMYYELTNKRADEKTISYAECHDQAMVGDKTIIFWLLDKEMYTGMSCLSPSTPIIDRGIALHKMIRLASLSTAGNGYLNFMGNEFGHPEWIDFPREGNEWSYHYARRQWNLLDNNDLRYKFLWAWDKAMIALCKKEQIFDASPFAIVQNVNDQVLVFKRNQTVFAYNFNPTQSFAHYGFEIDEGIYEVLLCSDDAVFGGFGRVDKSVQYATVATHEKHYLKLYLPNRTVLALQKKS